MVPVPAKPLPLGVNSLINMEFQIEGTIDGFSSTSKPPDGNYYRFIECPSLANCLRMDTVVSSALAPLERPQNHLFQKINYNKRELPSSLHY